MKNFVPCALLCATTCLGGCFSVEKAPLKSGGEHVVMSNFGWKLFDAIPLWCGNATEGATTAFALFRDDVTAEKVQKRFMKYANGREVECPVFDIAEEKGMQIMGIPIPGVYTYRKVTLSGTVK